MKWLAVLLMLTSCEGLKAWPDDPDISDGTVAIRFLGPGQAFRMVVACPVPGRPPAAAKR